MKKLSYREVPYNDSALIKPGSLNYIVPSLNYIVLTSQKLKNDNKKRSTPFLTWYLVAAQTYQSYQSIAICS